MIFILFMIDLFCWLSLQQDIKTISIVNAILLIPFGVFGGTKIWDIREKINELYLEISEFAKQIDENKNKKIILESQLKHGVDE